MDSFNTPNVVLPLAISYNERGIDGYTTTVTSAKDQRKINSMYEPVVNSISGKRTLYLIKRPGIQRYVSSIGSSSDIPYLAIVDPSGVRDTWMACRNGTNCVVKDNNGTTTTVISGGSNFPVYFDRTVISGAQTGVLQTDAPSVAAPKTWYSTAIGTWTQISDADYTGLSIIGKMEHLDGYAFQLTKDNKVCNSDLNSLANWTASGYITKAIEQDVGRGLMRLGQVILAGGMETIEGFVNAGNATGSPLRSVPDLSTRIGIEVYPDDVSTNAPAQTDGQRHYSAIIGKRLYFMSRTGIGGRAVYAFDGSRFEKVSTPFIDKLFSNTGNWRHFCPVTVRGQTALAISFTTPSTATQRWLMFFPEWNDWFEWNSTGVQCANSGYAFLGIGGQSTANELAKVVTNETFLDGTTESIPWSHQFQLPSNGNKRTKMHWFGVKGDTATSALSLSVAFSDNDYQTFKTARVIDMTGDRKQIYRCGSYKDQRAVRLSNTANVGIRLEEAIAMIE